VKAGLAVGLAGAATVVGAATLPTLLDRPDVDETIRYTRFPTPQWWNSREGSPVRVTDFETWQGASASWRATFVDGTYLPGSGYPLLVIRVPRDDSVFRAPSEHEVPVPSGYGLFYDDPDRDLRFVVVYDRCAHLCCFPGWHIVTDPPPSRDYENYVQDPERDVPTWYAYGQDPIYCVCHGSQYDPMLLVRNVNPFSGVEYVGPQLVHGPSARAIPVVPVRAADDILLGGMPDPRWFEHCGD
jgi:Rieske Fe-S protein